MGQHILNKNKPTLHLFGDSVVRNVFSTVCYLLDPAAKLPFVIPHVPVVGCAFKNKCSNENATVYWHDTFGSWKSIGDCGVDRIETSSKPVGIVMNVGNHLLQLSPARSWNH